MRKRCWAWPPRVPLVGWGFDSQPDDFDPPAKCFVLRLDTLKILPDVLLVLLDSFKVLWDHIKSKQDILPGLADNIKSTRDHIKSKHDILPGLRDNIKSTRDHIKSKHDIKSTRDHIKIRASQFLFLSGNTEIQPNYLLFSVDKLNSSGAGQCSTPDGFVGLRNCFPRWLIWPSQFAI